MTGISIRITGLDNLNYYLTKLPKNLQKNMMSVSNEFCVFVQRSAKLRAPHLTTDLAESIKVKPGKNKVSVVIDSPYAYFQIMGFKPHMIYPSMDNRNGRKLSELGFTHPVWARKHTDFLTPALEMGLNRLPNMLEGAMDKALNEK